MDFKPVTYYTHTGSDQAHSTEDSLAFILREVNKYTADLVIFPVGGPTLYERVSRFPEEEAPIPPAGGSYFRAQDEDPPDFGELYAHDNSLEWHQLAVKQRHEWDSTPVKDREELGKVHRREQDELIEKLSGEASSAPEPGPAEVSPQSPPRPAPRPNPPQPMDKPEGNGDKPNNGTFRRDV